MVIGNGLIASKFREIDDENNGIFLFFASGVSNSNERDPNQFLREERLLRENLRDKSLVLVYFSTVSVFDADKMDSPYILHKLRMENIVKKHAKSYLILRLPNVIGSSGNPLTMFNFFRNRILLNEETQIEENAMRYLIDISDVVEIFQRLKDERNKVLNVVTPYSISVFETYHIIAQVLEKPPLVNLIQGGKDYSVNLDSVTMKYWEDKYRGSFNALEYFREVALKYVNKK